MDDFSEAETKALTATAEALLANNIDQLIKLQDDINHLRVAEGFWSVATRRGDTETANRLLADIDDTRGRIMAQDSFLLQVVKGLGEAGVAAALRRAAKDDPEGVAALQARMAEEGGFEGLVNRAIGGAGKRWTDESPKFRSDNMKLVGSGPNATLELASADWAGCALGVTDVLLGVGMTAVGVSLAVEGAVVPAAGFVIAGGVAVGFGVLQIKQSC